MKSADFEIYEGTTAEWKLHLCLFLWNLKYYQNEIWSNTSVCCMTYSS